MNTDRTKPRGRPADPTLTARRCEEILDAAGRHFAERGYPGMDVQALANELGVGKGTVYRYFPTKRDLFLAAVDRAMRRLCEHVDAANSTVTEPVAQLSRTVQAFLEFFDKAPDLVELFIQERAEFKARRTLTCFADRDAHVGRWLRVFQALIADGRLRRLPPERIAAVISDLLCGVMFTHGLADRCRSSATRAKDILKIVFHGILTDQVPVRRRVLPKPGG
jgi:AcrR family transcriptional regulator